MAKWNKHKNIINRINKLKRKYKEMGLDSRLTAMFDESKCFDISRYDDNWYMEWFTEGLNVPYDKVDIPNIMKSCNYVWGKLNEENKNRL